MYYIISRSINYNLKLRVAFVLRGKMYMRKFIFIVIVILILSGCQKEPVIDEKELMEQALIQYIENDIGNIEADEKKIISSFNTFIADDSKTSNDMVAFLEETIIPQYEVFYNSLKSINPENTEIAEAHNYYISSSQFQLEAFIFYHEGLKNSDQDKIEKVNFMLMSSKEDINLYKKKLISIAEKYDIKYTIN